MSTEWAVLATAEQINLDGRNAGELTFTVSNPGEVDDVVVFDVVPGEGSDRSWFSVERPQRTVPARDSVTFRVKVNVPARTAPRRYEMTGLAYSANTAPEESSRSSGRVTYDVKATGFRLPWLMIIIALLLVVAVGAVTWILLSGKTPPPRATATDGPATPATPGEPPRQPTTQIFQGEDLVSGASVSGEPGTSVATQQDCCGVVWSGHAQLFFRANAAGDRLSLSFTIPDEGDYVFTETRTTSWDYANTQWELDGNPIGDVFLGYSPSVAIVPPQPVGQVHLTAGTHTLTLVIVSKSQATSKYFAGIDQIQFTAAS